MIEALRLGLQADGITVSIAKYTVQRVFQRIGWQVRKRADWLPTSHSSHAVASHRTERALVYRHVLCLGQS